MMQRPAALATLLLAAGCAAPAGVYTAQSTYEKLITQYPFIRVAGSSLPAGVKRIDGVVYASYGKRSLQLDLYLPAGRPAPAIVFVHGGGWRSGNRDEFGPIATRLAQRGYASAAISYRLSPEARYPAAVDDVKAAVRWLRANSEGYGIDPSRIALAGGSAGGQLASLAAMTGDGASTVQAIINIDGLSDFTSPEALLHEDDPAKNPSAAGQWLGGRYADKADVWRDASPLTHAGKDTPPILFIGSAQKRFGVGREAVVETLRPYGISTSIVDLPGTPHSFWLFDPWVEPTVDAIASFLDARFGQSASTATLKIKAPDSSPCHYQTPKTRPRGC